MLLPLGLGGDSRPSRRTIHSSNCWAEWKINNFQESGLVGAKETKYKETTLKDYTISFIEKYYNIVIVIMTFLMQVLRVMTVK